MKLFILMCVVLTMTGCGLFRTTDRTYKYGDQVYIIVPNPEAVFYRCAHIGEVLSRRKSWGRYLYVIRHRRCERYRMDSEYRAHNLWPVDKVTR